MKFVTPRDWESTSAFARLVVQCHKAELPHPRVTATYLYFRLWTELAYQMALHQEPGRFDRRSADGFVVMTETPGVTSAAVVFGLFELAEILVPMEYGWFCPHFASDNYWQGYGWIDGDEKRKVLSRWREGNECARQGANQTAAIFSDELWLGDDGVRVSPEKMNAMIVLVRNADSICKCEEREPADFTPAIMRAARAIVFTMKPDNLEMVLRRIYYLSRQTRPDFRIPRDPEQLLASFKQIVPIICPEELWKDWEKLPY